MGQVSCAGWGSRMPVVVRTCWACELGPESHFVTQWSRNGGCLCIADWLYKCSVQKLVVVISNIESGEVLERWQFDIECDKTAKDDR